MAYMFERLDRANRFNSRRIPEFLLTHPVTKDRIADAYNQTRGFPQKIFPTSLDFQLMKARASVLSSDGDADLIPRLEAGLKSTDANIRSASQYGMVLAMTTQGRVDAAQRKLNPLLTEYPGKIAFTLAQAQLHTQVERYDNATDVLEKALSINIGNYELSMSYADVLMRNRQASAAVSVLLNLTKDRPNDVDLWYVLAEAYGLANDVIGVHEARAEYFVLIGNLDQAIKQLGYALPLARDNFGLTARLRQRIDTIHGMRRKLRRS
jgi:predicted Zn-dependent protease